jgi:small subunit ribosomal protein S20
LPAEKTTRAQENRRIINRRVKTASRTAVKKAHMQLAKGDTEGAPKAVADALKALDKASSKSVIHRNNAARRKSRLQISLNRVAKT